MTRTDSPTPTPTPVTDPAVQALVRIIGVFAIICLIGLGYLMVQKSNADAEHSGDCLAAQVAGYVPRDCR